MKVFPVNPCKKSPAIKNWRNTSYIINDENTLKQWASKWGAVGIALDEKTLVIDVDPRNGGFSSLDTLQKKTGLTSLEDLTTAVRTGGGGFHFYFHLPDNKTKILGALEEYPGIDFLSAGRFVIAPHSKISKKVYLSGKGYVGNESGLYERLRGSIFYLSVVPDSLLSLIHKNDKRFKMDGKEKVTEQKKDYCFKLLKKIPATSFREYDDWIKLLFSAKTSGIDFEDFLGWCISDRQYNTEAHKEAIKDHWLSANGQGITPKTMEYYARLSGVNTSNELIKEQFATVEGDAKRKNLLPVSGSSDRSKFTDWVYLENTANFFNVKGKYYNSFSALSVTLHHLLKKNKLKFFMDTGVIKRFIGVVFEPNGDQIHEKEGYQYLNLWSKADIKPVNGSVELYIDFLRHFWPDTFENILDWMAAIAQGIRPRYMLLIHSTRNQVGKSFFIGSVMKKICGYQNVHSLTYGEVTRGWNQYLSRAHLVVIEELYAGDKKLQFYNTIKEFITEPKVTIMEKHVSSYTIDNHSVYMAYTNYMDALLLNPNDPRVLVVSTTKDRKNSDYYKKLAAWLKDSGYEKIYNFLLSRKISAVDFYCAPITSEKNDMARLSRPECEIFLDEEVFSNSEVNYSHEFLCIKIIKSFFTDFVFSSKAISKVLYRRGYTSVIVRIDNEVFSVFVSGNLINKFLGDKRAAVRYVSSQWVEMLDAFKKVKKVCNF